MIKNKEKSVGKKNIHCGFCNGSNTSLIIDFGNVALAGAFLKLEEFSGEKKYPLQLYFCEDCYLLQIIDKIPPEILFKDYFYFSSAIGTLRKHFKKYAKEVSGRFLNLEKSTVVEIGCNDGVLLNPFSEIGIKTVIGVDPATNVVKKINNSNVIVFNDFFSEMTAGGILNKVGHADIIAANNVYAHIDKIHDATRGIKKLLAKDGVFIFEVHYIGNLIEELQYDMIYHEHLYYYSLITLDNFLNQFNMEIFDIKRIPIHAGSMRYYVREKGGLKRENVSKSVLKLREEELNKKYDKIETYSNFARRVEKSKIILMSLLNQLKRERKTIYGYGASGRANTMIQYCGMDNHILDCIIDDAPAKHGFYTPGSHFVIRPRQLLEDNPPDYILVFAWSFIKEIISKNMDYINKGGKMIVPLPEVKIISSKNGEIIEETGRI